MAARQKYSRMCISETARADYAREKLPAGSHINKWQPVANITCCKKLFKDGKPFLIWYILISTLTVFNVDIALITTLHINTCPFDFLEFFLCSVLLNKSINEQPFNSEPHEIM